MNQEHGMPRTSAIPYKLISHLPWLWIVGTPLTFALLVTGLVGSERLRRAAKPASGLILETCERLVATLAPSRKVAVKICESKVAVKICESIADPVLIGIIRPLILLPPAALTGWSPEQLEMVLLHELAHVRRWDNLLNLAQRIVESLLFFHPCVWWLSRQVRIDRELCVDALVVARTAKPQAYAELLVDFAAARRNSNDTKLPRTLTASAMARHPLVGRIRSILNLEDEPMLVNRSTVTLAVFAAVAVVSIVLWQPALRSVAQGSKPVAHASGLSSNGEKETKAEKTTKGTKEPSNYEEDISWNNESFPGTIRVQVPRDMPLSKFRKVREMAQAGNKRILITIGGDELSILEEDDKPIARNSPFPTLEEQRAADLVLNCWASKSRS